MSDTINLKIRTGKPDPESLSLDLEGRPLTLICHKGDIDIEKVEGIPELNPDVTRFHGDRVERMDPLAQAWAEYILCHPIGHFATGRRPAAVSHIMGLCDLIVKLGIRHKERHRFFVRLPETYLHPRQQTQLADFFVAMGKDDPPFPPRQFGDSDG